MESSSNTSDYHQRVRKVLIGGEIVANFSDSSDDESGLSQEEKEQRSRFWGGGKNRKYHSKKGTRFGRRQRNNHNAKNDNYNNSSDDDAKSAGSGSSGNFAMVTPTGSFRATTTSAIGVYPTSLDKIAQDLTQSELELDQMEANMMMGYGQTDQQKQQSQQNQYQQKHQQNDVATLADTHNSGISTMMIQQHRSKNRKVNILFYIIGIVLFLMMCALFAIGGYIMYTNHIQDEDGVDADVDGGDGE